MSLSVIDGCSASKAVITDSPRASDWTNWSPGAGMGSVMRESIGPALSPADRGKWHRSGGTPPDKVPYSLTGPRLRRHPLGLAHLVEHPLRDPERRVGVGHPAVD